MPWLPLVVAGASMAAGAVGGAMGNRSSSSSTQYRDMANASALERRLIGGTESYKEISPQLRALLEARGQVTSGMSSDEALNAWNSVKGSYTDLDAGALADSLSREGDVINREKRRTILDQLKQLKDWSHGDGGPETITKTRELGAGQLEQDYNYLLDWTKAYEGDADALSRHKSVADARAAQGDLGAMLERLRTSGGLPDDADISAGNNAADKLFAGRRMALQQTFSDQQTDYARRAAAMGRDVLDPILQAKMRTEQSRQSGLLNADQGAEAQRIAMGLPGQKLQYQQMLTDFKGGLAAQAYANRAAIMNIGSQMLGQERNWRFQTAPVVSEGSQTSGGGVGGAITGGLAGLGAGLSMGSSIKGLAGSFSNPTGGTFNQNLPFTGGDYGLPQPSSLAQQYPWLGGGTMGGISSMGPASFTGGRTFSSAGAYSGPSFYGGNYGLPGVGR